MRMRLINIASLLEGKSYPDAGAALYPHIESAINSNQMLVIDMTGVDSIPTLFMNTSFGEALGNFGMEKFRKYISFCHIKKAQADRIKEYLYKYELAYLTKQTKT